MLKDIQFLDDATRPPVQKLEGLTNEQREPGLHLRMIHDHLRRNMVTLGHLIERASKGNLTHEQIADETNDMAMVANYRRFGNLCGQHCQIVEMHHSIEDAAVHELLERLVDALNAMVSEPTPQRFEEAKTVYHALERVLLSHLGYEEDAMGDALGYFGIGV